MHTTPWLSRRQVLKLLGVAGTTTLIAACAPPPAAAPSAGSAAEPTSSAAGGEPSGHVVMWAFPLTQNDPEAIWNPLVEKFAEQYPNVEVEVQMQSWDARREKMLAAAAAQATPDLAYLNNDMVFSFAQAGAIVALDDYLQNIAPDLVGQYPTGMIEGLKYEGKLMMLPILSGAVCGLYNKTLYEQIGLDPTKNPQSIDDLRSLCAQAKTQNLYGLSHRVNNLEAFNAYLYGFGGRLLSPDHQTSLLDSEESIETFKFIVDLFAQEYVPKAGATASADAAAAAGVDYFVQQEQVATEYTSAMSLIGQYQEQVEGIQLGIAEVLQAPDGTRRSTPTLGCLGIFAAGQNRDAAAYWLTWLLQPENLAFYNTQGGFVPPTAVAREQWDVDPVTKEWGSQVEYIAVDQDIQYYYNNNITFIQPVLSAAALGQMTPEDAAKQSAQQMNEYIKQNPL
jgi:multiple sugar transport system substrate-binding protein